ncbi:MBL fold metallo-hydrolase [Flavimarina sp. Hel_I_48]|uniref:MBL fold metallo-hydrolase n=1 Tax=Flavimarina sp. Hel_I_48 TaxID=1392488 RepID=UPI0004DFB3BD|nr:MBL fold metallo-hydrolase [Flavimarina sp. Hel_I_48]
MIKYLPIFVTALLFISTSVFAQRDFSEVEIKIVPVKDSIYMLQGSGGNIGLSVGNDGVFMIDDEFAELSEKITAAIRTLSNKPIKFLANTHFHGDHTGGNGKFEDAGAVVLAQENVRKRLKNDDKSAGLPVITFKNDLTLHLNGNDIMAVHVDSAHTDSDALIYFPQSNVMHTGDTFITNGFPFIDLKSGGSIDGDIEAGKAGLMLANSETIIIPGHGELATYSDYETYVDMLKTLRENVQNAINNGKKRSEISTMENLTSTFYTDAEADKSFINGPKIRETIYDSLKAKME